MRETAGAEANPQRKHPAMTAAAQRLSTKPSSSPPRGGATLAADLLASLDGEPEPRGEVDAAWSVESRKRLDRVPAGEPGTPWEEVRDEIRARPKARRDG